MSYSFYKIVHVLGFLLAIGALAGVALHAANGGTRATNRLRKGVAIAHGVGLALILVAGFGLLAILGGDQGGLFPGWVWAKLVIWLFLGAAIALPYRKPEWAAPIFFLLPILGALAAYLALYKPF